MSHTSSSDYQWIGSERRCLAHNSFRGRPLLPFAGGLRLVTTPRRVDDSECYAYSLYKWFYNDPTTLRPLVMELVVPRQHHVSLGVPPSERDRRLCARHGEHVSKTRGGRVHRSFGGRAGDDCVEDIKADTQVEGKARVRSDWRSACKGGALRMSYPNLVAIMTRCPVGCYIDSAVSYSCPCVERVRRSCDVFLVG